MGFGGASIGEESNRMQMGVQEERSSFRKKKKIGEKFKARFVAKGYSQRKGVDYDEISSPVVRHTSMRIVVDPPFCPFSTCF